jgi:hypothetical protein
LVKDVWYLSVKYYEKVQNGVAGGKKNITSGIPEAKT